ncbi:MAG: glycosyltransferase, partial [Saprospiraceae bacterium]|nr:glycosyltransferase [Saprospiraceae bacterium]
MKICIVTTAFPRWIDDGRGAFVFGAACALKKQGNQVRVIAMHNPGAKQREVMEGIDVIRPRYLPDRWEILQKDSAGLPQAWKSNPWSRLAVLPFLLVHTAAVAYWSHGYDIIHANWTLSAASSLATQWIHHSPYVVTVQGSDIFQAAKMRLAGWVSRQALQKASKVICLSRALANEVNIMGIPGSKVCVIPNGVDLTKFKPSPLITRENIILFVGSLIKRKGVDILLKAFAIMANDLTDYRLVLIGEGDLRESLELAVHHQKLENQVIFVGPQSQTEVKKWMQHAKVFVLPSIEEGQGVVLLEALACGTPCVGSNIGGIPDVIVPEVGRIVNPG